jgi:hypothetical protein
MDRQTKKPRRQEIKTAFSIALAAANQVTHGDLEFGSSLLPYLYRVTISLRRHRPFFLQFLAEASQI